MKAPELAESQYHRITCPMEFTMNAIAGKWKLVILWHIYDEGTVRYGELKRLVNNITHKMLSAQLKELQEFNLIHKHLYHQVPPKTEYTLTDRGETLIPLLKMMYNWGHDNMAEIREQLID